MKKVNFFWLPLLIIFFVCSNPEKEFNKAKQVNTIEAYNGFLEKYPETEFSQAAKDSIIRIEFEKAIKTHTIEIYNEFLEKYPQSSFNQAVKDSIIKIEFKKVVEANTISEYRSFLSNHPNSDYQKTIEDKLSKLMPKLLKANQAFQIFNNLNNQEKLLPSPMVGRYNNLSKNNCFGLVLPNGSRILGESSGKDYGLSIVYFEGGSMVSPALIGMLKSELGFSIENTNFKKGLYLLYLTPQKLVFFGGKSDATMDEFMSSRKSFKLNSKIDSSLLEKDSSVRPKYSLSFDDNGNIFINLKGNKVIIKI